MKATLRKIAPTVVLDYFNKLRYSRKNDQVTGKSSASVFKEIYDNNRWGSQESVSGQGSTLLMSSEAIRFLNDIIRQYEPKSILDLPCGDFNWMQKVNLAGVDYLGGDIVEELIDKNAVEYGSENIRFRELDLINDSLPEVDLIIVRDCFVHFSFDEIDRAIENLKRSGSKYLLTTTFTKLHFNYDIVTGDWRPINLRKKPFNFPEPLIAAEEFCPPKYQKQNRGKSLALWRLSDV